MKKHYTIALALAALVSNSGVANAAAKETLSERDELACEELDRGQYQNAIDKLIASGAQNSGDPALLINLGTAYFENGDAESARELYNMAYSIKKDIEVQLENGSWVSHRRAARKALMTLRKGK